MSITLGEAVVVVETPELVIEGDLPEFIVITEALTFEITVEDVIPDFVEAETPTGVGTILPVIGPPGPAGDSTITRTTAHVIAGHRAVSPRSDGLVEYATTAELTHMTRPFWLSTDAWASGVPASLTAHGEVVEPSWSWTPGQLIYLGVDGLLTQTPPPGEFVVVLGSAITATAIFFDPHPPIRLA